MVVGFACVLVVLGRRPAAADLADARRGWTTWRRAVPGGPRRPAAGVTHVLPVVFDGEDLDDVAAMVGLTPGRVVDLMVGAPLDVAFVGFAPGFPYLTGLPPELAALPRRDTPRTSVPAGSVAVAGGFAAVYPRATPGGWHLLGRTTESLFDPDRPPHSRVAPGRPGPLRRRRRGRPGAAGAGAADRPLLAAGGGPYLEVLEPGPARPRPGRRSDGCRRARRPPGRGGRPPGTGAGQPAARQRPAAAAAVECTASGRRCGWSATGTWPSSGVGPGAVDVAVDGRPVPDAAVVPVDDGQVVSVGRVRRGLRAYLGVAGGLDTPQLFGSRSSDVLSGLGPGAAAGR